MALLTLEVIIIRLFLIGHNDYSGNKETWIWSDCRNEIFDVEFLISDIKKANSIKYVSLSVWDVLGDLLVELSKNNLNLPMKIYILNPLVFNSKYYTAECILKLYYSMRNKGLKILIDKTT